MADIPPGSPPDGKLRKRSGDRRNGDRVSAPPYFTHEGVIQEDRRSHLERRSCWLRSFAIESGERED